MMSRECSASSLYFTQPLKEAIQRILSYPLTVIEAPMGYGKTTAVRECLNDSGAHIYWQKIHDGSITGFWNGLCHLIEQTNKECANSLLHLGFPDDSVSLQQMVAIVQRLTLKKSTILVIDDFHLLNATEAGVAVRYIVENEIENLHIVLTARYICGLNMDELILKNYLWYIGKESLEFLPDDILKYYKSCGIKLKKPEAEKLYLTTEGWISALYLSMLKFEEDGTHITTDSIYKLFESVIYRPLSDKIKDMLICLCMFDSFTKEQAVHMCGEPEVNDFLAELTQKNAFIRYDVTEKVYQMHNIFATFLQELFAEKGEAFKKNLNSRAGKWCAKSGENLDAMGYFYKAGDFDSLLCVMERDKTNSFGAIEKELLVKYFEECPDKSKQDHLLALLSYSMTLMTFHEMDLFEKVCGEFLGLLEQSNLEQAHKEQLMGEFELLLSFTKYNDSREMMTHQKRAWELLKQPSKFLDTKGSWTFGAPSVLYLFHRESGRADQEVEAVDEGIQYYYKLSGNHGMGANHVMSAERYFNKGDFVNAEIVAHKAFYQASSSQESNIAICALFMQVRLCLIKGGYKEALRLMEEMHQAVEQKDQYILTHTVEMCEGFIYASLNQYDKVPKWLAEGDFGSSRLYFQAKAFANIIYGRVLLIQGEYLKLLGIAEELTDIASIFPNLLASIYTSIHVAAANLRIYRGAQASASLIQALDMAMPDKLYMPFVENCDFIQPLLEDLCRKGIYCEDIDSILALYKVYSSSISQIESANDSNCRPKLTGREREIAVLASEGYSNKGIGETLFISENTVKKHLKTIFEKLDVNSRALLKQHLSFDV